MSEPHSEEEVQPKESLAKRLQRLLWGAPRPKPSLKEFREALAFVRRIEPLLKQKGLRNRFLIDVCGGHGLIALLCLIFRVAESALVIDPCQPLSHQALLRMWAPLLGIHIQSADAKEELSLEELLYDRRDMHLALPEQIARLMQAGAAREEIIVVACHACAHLTTSILDICSDLRVRVCVMSCCHKDRSPFAVKGVAKTLGMPLGAAMDLITMGRMIERGFDVRWRSIDPEITDQNRILCCFPKSEEQLETERQQREEETKQRTERLLTVYNAAHRTVAHRESSDEA